MREDIRFSYMLSGPRQGEALEGDAIAEALESPDLAWVHMRAHDPETAAWISSNLGYLDEAIRSALIAEETRPRTVAIGNGLMLILRAVNTNPGEEPGDMVSLRLWVDPARIVSLSRRPITSLQDLAAEVAAGRGPDGPGLFMSRLLSHLNRHMEDALDAIEAETDALEDEVSENPNPRFRERISDARQQVVSFRRYVSPQRDALTALAAARLEWLTKSDRRSLGEAHDRTQRYVEELDAMRDGLALIRDELSHAQAERLNRNLYYLSVISVIFLPLGFLTGLMGINLAGMPGAEWPVAFWTFVGLLVVVIVVQLAILRWLRMF